MTRGVAAGLQPCLWLFLFPGAPRPPPPPLLWGGGGGGTWAAREQSEGGAPPCGRPLWAGLGATNDPGCSCRASALPVAYPHPSLPTTPLPLAGEGAGGRGHPSS